MNCAAKRWFTPIPAWNSSLLLGSSALAEVWLCSSLRLHFSFAFYVQKQVRDRGGWSEEEGPKVRLHCCHELGESKVKPACPGLQCNTDEMVRRLLQYLAYYFIFNPTTSPWKTGGMGAAGPVLAAAQPANLDFLKNFWDPLGAAAASLHRWILHGSDLIFKLLKNEF